MANNPTLRTVGGRTPESHWSAVLAFIYLVLTFRKLECHLKHETIQKVPSAAVKQQKSGGNWRHKSIGVGAKSGVLYKKDIAPIKGLENGRRSLLPKNPYRRKFSLDNRSSTSRKGPKIWYCLIKWHAASEDNSVVGASCVAGLSGGYRLFFMIWEDQVSMKALTSNLQR